MIELTVTSSTGELRQKMVVAANTLADWRPFFDAWGDLWLESRREMFATGGASTGTPWPEYSKATGELQWAAIKGKFLGRRMRRSDVLRFIGSSNERLFPSMTESGHAENIQDVSENRMTVGTRVPYASSHDEGAGRAPAWMGGQTIPRRNLLEFGLQLESDTSALVGAFAAAGLSSIDERGKARAGLSTSQVLDMMRGSR